MLRLNAQTEVEPFLKDASRSIVEIARAEE
jgi:hypothetical protein